MKHLIFSVACLFMLNACKNDNSFTDIPLVSYPKTDKSDVTDNYFGTMVADPYRWLENDTAPEVEVWVKEQKAVTDSFLNQIPFREKIKSRLTELYNYERVSLVMRAGDYILYARNDGLQNQPVIYKRNVLNGQDEVFIDPNKLSKEGTVAVNIIGMAEDKKYVAVSKSASGSDWEEISVKEVASGKDLPDHLKYVKFSEAAFSGEGFYYSRFPAPVKGHEFQALNSDQKVYYHKLGDPQEKDVLIYEDKAHPLRYNQVSITEDRQFLILYISEGTDGFECHYKKTDQKKGGFIPLFTGFENKSSIVDYHNGQFYVLTDIDAPNYRLIAVDPNNPEKENWKEIIPEKKHLLQGVYTAGGKLMALYLQDVSSRLYSYSYDGTGEKEIAFPMLGSAEIEYSDKDEQDFFYSFATYTYPTAWFSCNAITGNDSLFFQSPLKFNPADYQIDQVFYTGKDSARVPMFIVQKKGLKRNGKNPALLYGYGGFNVAETPYFSPSIIALLDFGAIYAVANIRGGNEYGEAWHKAGMLLNKQTVFDDFIAAAEYLVKEKYTSSSKLGIFGGSNGGLLVGACMVQRPDLFKVAIPAVGVMDMLRFQKFTVGFGWVDEYGSSDDSTHFKNLYSFSPIHNLKPRIQYPATLVVTSDHDDRVVPAHSFKFIATLQEMQAGPDPVLIRIETEAGHGAGKPISKRIEETTDIWSFFFFNTRTKI